MNNLDAVLNEDALNILKTIKNNEGYYSGEFSASCLEQIGFLEPSHAGHWNVTDLGERFYEDFIEFFSFSNNTILKCYMSKKHSNYHFSNNSFIFFKNGIRWIKEFEEAKKELIKELSFKKQDSLNIYSTLEASKYEVKNDSENLIHYFCFTSKWDLQPMFIDKQDPSYITHTDDVLIKSSFGKTLIFYRDYEKNKNSVLTVIRDGMSLLSAKIAVLEKVNSYEEYKRMKPELYYVTPIY